MQGKCESARTDPIHGLPFAALTAAATADKAGDLTVSCDKKTALLDMRPEFIQTLMDLKPGEASPVVGLRTLRWAAVLVDWNKTPPPTLDDARDTILSACQNDRFRQALQLKLAPLEWAADIRMLDEPEPAPAPESVFQQILKESPNSPVARLGVFWEAVLAKDPKTSAAFDQVLATRALDVFALEQLAKALGSRSQTGLADRARAAAAKQ